MKYSFFISCLLLFNIAAISQSSLKGVVKDSLSKPIPFASVKLEKVGATNANEDGAFYMPRLIPGTYSLTVSSIGYSEKKITITITPGENFQTIYLSAFNLYLEPVAITALRAGEVSPFTKSNITQQDIAKANLGQDLPFLLNQSPSVVVTSDAGNGVGYTGIRIRGSEGARINATLNGIPYNDAESQGIYFVDIPDIASSLSSLQIQRGVGTSSNGAGAFGASINLSTDEFNAKSYATISNSTGSFGTRKHTIKTGTGLLGEHFTIDTRISQVSSNGFIDRGSSNLKSLFLSGAYLNKQTTIRFNLITGKEKTYQAWNGIPEAKLFGDKAALDEHYQNNKGSLYKTMQDSVNLYAADSRKYNYFTYNNQSDNYQQDHYQLFVNHRFNNNWQSNFATFLTKGKGYYEEFKVAAKYKDYGFADPIINGTAIKKTDLVRQLWLDNYFYGGIGSLNYKKENWNIIFGGAITQYDGKHYGNVIWAMTGFPKDYQWYNHTATKKDRNVYAKVQYRVTKHLYALVDLQYRNVDYKFSGSRKFPTLVVDETYNFFNPKAGLTYSKNNFSAYTSIAVANKEPNRNDFEVSGNQPQPRPERLYDFEVGMNHRLGKLTYGITGYYMKYKDQLVLTGKVNDVGDYISENTSKSYRLGVELEGSYKINNWLLASGNLTVSSNKILNYTESVIDYATYDYIKNNLGKTNIAFSPNVVAAYNLTIVPCTSFEITLPGKYVGKQYLDNTSSNTKSIRDYYVQDVKLSYNLKPKKTIRNIGIYLQVNNLFNRKYQSNGYTYSFYDGGKFYKENFYFPMAGTNFLAGLSFEL